MRAMLLSVVLACLCAPGTDVKAASDFDAAAYALPGKLVDVGGRKLNLLCRGSGSPTVVFESGLGGAGWDWAPVHAAVARQSRACLYDRAGYGFSDPGNRPGTTAHAAEDLDALLRNAGERAPYVLVGASYGSMIVRFFAAKRPGDVAALVLVDGHHEDEFERINGLSVGRYVAMMVGLETNFRDCKTASHRGLQPGSKDFKTCVGPPPAFADRKLAVMQQETADLSRAGRTRVIAKASHAIHIDNPPAVTAAVLEFVTPQPR